MARRQRLPSWVQDADDEDEKPLRDLIDPYLAKLEEIDKLEQRLNKVDGTTDPEDFAAMERVLQARRRKIMKQRARAYGLPEEEATNVQGYHVEDRKYRSAMLLSKIEPWMFWTVLAFFIALWIASQSS